MNKKIASMVTLILALAAFAPNSFAGFSEYKMVGALNDTTPKTVFGWNETPYLYMQLPADGRSFTGSFWHNPVGDMPFHVATDDTAIDRWVTLSNWNAVKKVGVWDVDSNYFHPNGNLGFASTSFTVTPEPLAMTLFLLGGAPIAANIYRKHRRARA
jgi:hypothetical protein